MPVLEILLIATIISCGLALLGFWVWMLVDCLGNEVTGGQDRIVWALIIILLKVFGAGIYYVMRYRPRHATAG